MTCLDICLDAYGHIDANVNQATFIEWWLDVLAAAALPLLAPFAPQREDNRSAAGPVPVLAEIDALPSSK